MPNEDHSEFTTSFNLMFFQHLKREKSRRIQTSRADPYSDVRYMTQKITVFLRYPNITPSTSNIKSYTHPDVAHSTHPDVLNQYQPNVSKTNHYNVTSYHKSYIYKTTRHDTILITFRLYSISTLSSNKY